MKDECLSVNIIPLMHTHAELYKYHGMSVLSVGSKCTLAASHVASW